MNNNKLQPAIIGGVALGLLSAIPFVNLFNACCCAWAVLGGALAVYLYIQKSATPVKLGEGALLGLMAGGIGAVIYLVVGLPLGLLTGNIFANMMARFAERANPEQAEILRAQIEAMQNQTIGERLLTALPFTFISLILIAAFATVGGLLGVALLEKRKGVSGGDGSGMSGATPPPFGGQSGGGYSGGDYASAPTPTQPFDNQPPPGNMGSGSSSSGNTGSSNL